MSKRLIVTVSEELYKTVQKLSKDMDCSPVEYIRFLILKDKEKKQTVESQKSA